MGGAVQLYSILKVPTVPKEWEGREGYLSQAQDMGVEGEK